MNRLAVLALEDRLAPAAGTPATLPVVPELDAATAGHLRTIAALGRGRGLRADVFAKLGDSNTATASALGPLGTGGALPAGLTGDDLATVARYRAAADAAGANSFTRLGVGAYPGWTTRQLQAAGPAEAAQTRAAVAVIQIGTNDARVMSSDEFRGRLGRLVDDLAAAGVVPVLSTVPTLALAGPVVEATVNGFNQVIADVAADRQVPLLNLWRALLAAPNQGLGPDLVHLSASASAANTLTGQGVRGFVTVKALTAVYAAAFTRDIPAEAAAAPESWTPLTSGQQVFAVGPGPGEPGVVTVRAAADGAVLTRVKPFGDDFLGGVRVATGDLTGDGVPDLVAAAGPGGGPAVRAYDGATGRDLGTVYAFDPGFTGGLTVAVGDADGDGRAEVAVGAGAGGGPRVAVLGPDLTPRLDFFAFDPDQRLGVSVALAGGVLAVGAGRGGGPAVATFDARTGAPRGAVMAFDENLRTGVTVAAGDLDGDGRPELVAGTGHGEAPAVRVFDAATLAPAAGFYAGDPAVSTGVRVAVVPAVRDAPGRVAVPGGLFTRDGSQTLAFDPGPDGGFGA